MPTKIYTPAVGIDLESTPTFPEFDVGYQILTSIGVFEYVQANGAIAQYAGVKIDDDGQAAEITTTTNPSTEPAKVGVAQVAFADNDYGFVWRGNGSGARAKFAASCVQDVKIYTTATAGVFDDASTTLVNGLKLITTITSATDAPCEAACLLTTVAA